MTLDAVGVRVARRCTARGLVGGPVPERDVAAWYFASGSTAGRDALYVSLLNPTSSPVVVDLSFITPTGRGAPVNYQGIVLEPGAVLVEDVAPRSRTPPGEHGRHRPHGPRRRIRAPDVRRSERWPRHRARRRQPEPHWAIPQAEEARVATSEIAVFNPGTTPEKVTVHLRLASGRWHR